MMSQEKNYQALHENMIFMGGASDVEAMVKNEGVEVVVDLRGEATECAYPEGNVEWIKINLGDHSTEDQTALFRKAIDEVLHAYHEGKKVAFHCGRGKGRTGAVAAGTLIELGQAQTL